ncbi:MAG: TetR family transcriptional regulator [Bacteroidetes bacterium]|nr:MAG: TetR family transcriptional regulator [Bacteroidota bacterium]
MQVQKTNIRQTILQSARHEFLEHGFKDASMRRIARMSNVTLSNIYNYFKNKDEIFYEVLRPLLETFEKLTDEHNNRDHITIDVFTMKSYQREMIDGLMIILGQYRAELKLLLFQASGSSLENFRDTFTDSQTIKSQEYMLLMKQKYPEINTDVSTFFIHTMTSWWLTLVGEIVTHDELSKNDIEHFVSEFVAFSNAGWKRLMQV